MTDGVTAIGRWASPVGLSTAEQALVGLCATHVGRMTGSQIPAGREAI